MFTKAERTLPTIREQLKELKDTLAAQDAEVRNAHSRRLASIARFKARIARTWIFLNDVEGFRREIAFG